MSASSSGALKAHIESLGLGISAYRDQAPTGVNPPYITISEAITLDPEDTFNQNADPQGHVREQVDVDVWQPWKDDDENVIESYTLADDVFAGLLGNPLANAPTHVAGMRVLSSIRRIEQDTNLVHTTISIELRRVLQREGS